MKLEEARRIVEREADIKGWPVTVRLLTEGRPHPVLCITTLDPKATQGARIGRAGWLRRQLVLKGANCSRVHGCTFFIFPVDVRASA